MRDYTVLIVDYDPVSLDSIRGILNRAGYGVEVARDGVAAIEAFGRVRPDLTLIEFMLPKKTGLDVIRELRQTPEGAGAQLVVMGSRFRSRQYRSEAILRFRASEFLEKPIEEATLLAVAERLLGVKRPAAANELAASPGDEILDFEIEVVNRLDSVFGRS